MMSLSTYLKAIYSMGATFGLRPKSPCFIHQKAESGEIYNHEVDNVWHLNGVNANLTITLYGGVIFRYPKTKKDNHTWSPAGYYIDSDLIHYTISSILNGET